MLNLNQPQTTLSASEPVWKILIYDRVGQDIISPLISVKELRELGVTLFVYVTCSCLVVVCDISVTFCSQLHSDRDPIPEVPAIYFCAPNEENLGRIGQDFQSGSYDVYHLNFISPISRQKLEDLASAALQANCVANIHKVSVTVNTKSHYEVCNYSWEILDVLKKYVSCLKQYVYPKKV